MNDSRSDTTSAAEAGTAPTVELVPLGMLKAADSPRTNGHSEDHVRALAEVSEGLPPILVHAQTLRVIDGMHRWHAAQLRGDEDIAVIFVDGDEDDVFVRAVRENISHGLPLTLDDRRAAALRILIAHPELSDRSVAGICGLSPKTVGAVRSRSTEEIPRSTVRVGKDGRTRPLPAQSVHSLENSVQAHAEADPEPSEQSPDERGVRDHRLLLQSLVRDPSLRFSEPGRALLRRLIAHSTALDEWDSLLAGVPPHCADTLTELASSYARAWGTVADRVRTPAPPSPP